MTVGLIGGAAPTVSGGNGLLQLAQAGGVESAITYGQLGRVVIPFSSAGEGAAGVFAALRPFGVLALPLMLSGDTPQPREGDLDGNLRLSVTADGKHAWLSEMRPGTTFFGLFNTMDAHTLNTRVSIAGGQISFDAGQLERELGHPLPPSLLAMERPDGQPTNAAAAVGATKVRSTRPCTLLDGTTVSVGQRAFEIHTVPPSAPHWPIAGDHMHLFTANQEPVSGRCFWTRDKQAYPPAPPAGTIPVQPFRP